ncbi:hypothetical protein CDAR_181611 [Caerostris darwini]|uniref:Uncharacterized protein n=1 Tax=Caerostris darwini TaxID=1538125 RepID=A0AAV4TPL3_9ARAC|nr:hypothetical protein CDAR_181611 [Caerostris darwini]
MEIHPGISDLGVGCSKGLGRRLERKTRIIGSATKTLLADDRCSVWKKSENRSENPLPVLFSIPGAVFRGSALLIPQNELRLIE